MAGQIPVIAPKHVGFGLMCSFIIMAAIDVHAATVHYRLENVILADSTQMSGTLSWTYDPGDFENGVGQFTYLDVPHTSHDHNDLNVTVDVGRSIEITFPGNFHDDGVDISLILLQPLTPTASSSLDLIESKYEIGGNGFHDGLFLSGVIALAGDADSDGVLDDADNCISHLNELQRDSDADGIGNACDPDMNNDCIVNATDLGLLRVVFFSSDPDADFNGDGVVNALDLGIFRQFFFQQPGPSGTPNSCSP